LKLVVRLAAFGVIFLASLPCHGAPDITKQHEKMQNELTSRRNDVQEWISDERHEVVLALVVGLLGLSIGACQTTARPWTRTATVILGLLVSVVTLCTNTLYTADYQTLRRAIHSTHPLLDTMQNNVNLYSPTLTPDDFNVTKTDFYQATATFDTIADNILGVNSATKPLSTPQAEVKSSSIWSIRTVFAQTEVTTPAWVTTNGQSDSLGTYFVGSYTDTSLEKAKTFSMDQARHRAAEHLQLEHPETRTATAESQLVTLLGQFETLTDTWIKRGDNVYTYYTRLRISNKIQDAYPSENAGNCTWTKLGRDRSLLFDRSSSPLYVFLSKQHLGSRNDTSDLFVTTTDPESLRDNVTARLTALAQASPETTKKLVLPSEQTVRTVIAGSTYTIAIQSHAFLRYGTVTVCALH
jgi:hypothetical protein